MQISKCNKMRLNPHGSKVVSSETDSGCGFQIFKTRSGSITGTLAAIIGFILIGVAGFYVATKPDSTDGEHRAEVHASKETSTQSAVFPVTIRKPAGPPRVLTGMTDAHGQPVTVACSTCHSIREPNFENKSVGDLNEFHGSMAFAHGSISCLSCHNSTDYDALKLADGTRVEFSDVMTLCAQCHGPQMRDYEHGTHGGMTGHWDLTRGPREKNNCVDCHAAHNPKFPKMQPTFKPRDRFLEKDNH